MTYFGKLRSKVCSEGGFVYGERQGQLWRTKLVKERKSEAGTDLLWSFEVVL